VTKEVRNELSKSFREYISRLALFAPEDKGTVILQKAGKYWPMTS
jgi:hypothetical protein